MLRAMRNGLSYGVVGVFVCVLWLLVPAHVCPAENAVAVGYGMGMWNGWGTGNIESGRPYEYVMFSYIREKTLTDRFALALEPFLNAVSRPDNGVDVGITFQLKTYLIELAKRSRVYAIVGAGAAYTTVGFKQQGTHGLFILQGGAGYQYQRVFSDVRFHHYSNGGLAYPNRSINSLVGRVGYYF